MVFGLEYAETAVGIAIGSNHWVDHDVLGDVAYEVASGLQVNSVNCLRHSSYTLNRSTFPHIGARDTVAISQLELILHTSQKYFPS